METHNSSNVRLLLCADVLLVICFADNCQEQSLNAKGRLDNVWNISLVCFRVKVIKALTACLDVLIKVIISSVGNAPKLAPAKWEQELKVCRSLTVEAKFFR